MRHTHSAQSGGASFPHLLDWIVAIPVLAIAAIILTQPAFPLDDAYITLHNARTLLAGGVDPSYAHSTALTGATSAVHLVTIAALGLILPLELASKFVSIAALSFYAAGLVRLFRQFGCPPIVRAVLLLSALCLGYQPFQLANGLETGVALAATVWALVLADSRWLPVLCGALPFVRPELSFLALPLMARRAWMLRHSPGRQIGAGALALAAALPWLLLYHQQTGAFLPNTGTAKIYFFAEAGFPLADRARTVADALVASLIAPLFLGSIGLVKSSRGWCGLVFVVAWLAFSMTVFPSGLNHNSFRYCAPFVPILAMGWARLLAKPFPWRQVVLAALGLWSLLSGTAGFAQLQDRDQTFARERMVADVARHVPSDAVIMVHDAGYLPWALPGRKLVDLVGLKTPDGIGWREALRTTGRADRARSLVRTAERYRPAYFVVRAHVPFWGSLADDLRAAGWSLVPLADGGPTGYAVFRISPPISEAATVRGDR